jgi:hypothetical protein
MLTPKASDTRPMLCALVQGNGPYRSSRLTLLLCRPALPAKAFWVSPRAGGLQRGAGHLRADQSMIQFS